MAGFMDSVNKGLATINVKTSNLMESSKIKTSITNKENEIVQIKAVIGETVFLNRNNFTLDMVSQQIADIEERMRSIEELKAKMVELEEAERSILGGNSVAPVAKVFCSQCGAPNIPGSKFCEKCGAKME
ncbi:MAG: zinc-ribbon domain-containing protein [Lachnospiraceae bacterium]|nr:zinc-ribbon domain-containing protein [Lachnospiraceae bacterium]